MAENIETVSQVSDGTELDEPPSEVDQVFETAEPFVYVRCPAVIKSKSEREEERKDILYEPTSEPMPKREDIEPGTSYDPSDDGLYVKSHPVHASSNTKSGNKLQQRLMMETGYRFVRESKPFKDIMIDWTTSKRNDENVIGNILNKNDDKELIGTSNSSSELVQFEPPRRRFLVDSIDPSSLLKHDTDVWNHRLRDQERVKPNPILECKNGLKNGLMSSDGMTLEQIQEWKRENLNQLDPFDEDNIELLAAIEAYEAAMEKSPGSGMKFYPRKIVLGSDGGGTSSGTSSGTGHTFRSNQGLEFCSLEEELNKPRNKMLILRSSGTVAHLKNIPVPLNEREVPLHLLNLNTPCGNKFSGLRGIEAKREKGISILSKLKDQLLLQSQGRYDRPRTLEDLVHEEESTSIL